MLSKQEFIECLDQVKSAFNFNEKFNDLLNKNGGEGYVFIPECSVAVIMLLNEVFHLKKESKVGTVIEYFVYELNFGKKYKKGCYRENGTGEPIDISTAELLYDHITKESGDE